MKVCTKTQAFNDLGYNHKATRGVWTAEREERVLATLWQQQMRWHPDEEGGTVYVDMDELHPSGDRARDTLPKERRHVKRATHLRRVWEGDANLDVVVLLGPVGNDKGEAIVWRDQENENRSWQVIWVSEENGFFRVEAKKKQVS